MQRGDLSRFAPSEGDMKRQSVIISILGLVAALLAPQAASAAGQVPTYIAGPGAPAFCRAAIPDYCRMVERRLRRDGPFEAAVAKARDVRATIWFTALPDGQVVAALFRHSSGSAVIDQGLMDALAPVQLAIHSATPQTFAMPIALHAINNTASAAFYIRVQRAR